MSVQNTAGHLGGNGGLRGHSVGGVFPQVIVAKGNPADLSWYVHSPDGTTSELFKEHDAAYAHAIKLNEEEIKNA